MTTRSKRTVLLLCAGCLISAGACGGGGEKSPAVGGTTTSVAASTQPAGGTASLTGTWAGNWQRTSAPPTQGTFRLTLTQQAGALTGTIDVAGSACLTTHPITGTVNGSAVEFKTVGSNTTAGAYTGTVSGNDMTGTLTVTCPSGVGIGTWQLKRA